MSFNFNTKLYKVYIDFDSLLVGKISFCKSLSFYANGNEPKSKQFSFILENEFEIKKERFLSLRLRETVRYETLFFEKNTVLNLFFPRKRPYFFHGVLKNDFAEILPFGKNDKELEQLVNAHLKQILEFDYNFHTNHAKNTVFSELVLTANEKVEPTLKNLFI